MTMQRGGKAVYGATLGILMLEAKFPRIHGDIGNANTWPFPVHYRVVSGATPDKIVRGDPRAFVDAFVEAAGDLVRMGCDGITTNCGFLSLIQQDLAARIGVPVATSSLMQAAAIQATLPPNKRLGILTISRATLSDAHLVAAGVSLDTPIVGTESGREFTAKILGNADTLDVAACRQDMLDAAHELVTQNDGIGAILLECTNMVPYAADIRRATGLPVFSIYTLVSWFQAGLLPRKFDCDCDDPRFV
jgi:Asp/Glu/hydantoin racemase